jgi:phage shock protein PspC (stress-responsive transcriptional regulator)
MRTDPEATLSRPPPRHPRVGGCESGLSPMVAAPSADESGAMDNPSPTTDTGAEQPPGGQPPSGQPSSGPRVTRDEIKDLGRLRRSVTDRHIAGVAGGIARHLDIDPIIVRVALVVGVFFGGAGLLLYVAGWILVPEEGTDDEPLGLDRRSRTIALGGVGVLALIAALGDWAGAFWFPWPLAILAALAVWFLHRQGGGSQSAPRPAREPYDGTYDGGYDATYAGAYDGTYDPAYPQTYARAPRPRNPRKRGPILFLFTLALIALAEGVLGVVDVAGADVTDSAYPALALGITALMLVVGSVWGRAGGLIALGLVAALATAGATASSHFPEERVHVHTPTSAGEVDSTYDFGGGEFVLDLSEIDDVESLDGREIAIDGFAGTVEVIVPDGVDVDVTTDVVGGDSRVFDRRTDGFEISVGGSRDGGVGAPDLTIGIDLVFGEIIVREAA